MAHIKLSPEITGILQRSTITGNLLCLPEGDLERPLYLKVADAIKKLGGAWKTNKKGFLFDSCPRTKLGLSLESGTIIDGKKQRQAFYTPKELATQVVALANVAGHVVLEPSAGGGALADECLRQGAAVSCIEIDEEEAKKLLKRYPTVVQDFLKFPNRPHHGKFTRIVMNPPFAKDQDIAHVEHALTWLKPGGILVAIMGGNTTRKKFQKLISCLDHDITEVPAGAFKQSGTNVSTIILRIQY